MNLTRSHSLHWPWRISSSLGVPSDWRMILSTFGIDLESHVDAEVATPLGIAGADQVSRENTLTGRLRSNDLFAFTGCDRVISRYKKWRFPVRHADRGRPCPRASVPRHRSGGYVHGQRKTVELLPAAASSSQIGIPRRMLTALGGRNAFFCSYRFERQLGKVVLGIAAEKIEDAMPAGVDARGECGPRHRGLGGPGSGDSGEAPLLFQSCQVRELVWPRAAERRWRVPDRPDR